MLLLGVQKPIFLIFHDFLRKKKNRKSGNRGRQPWNLEWDDLGISSETTWEESLMYHS